MSQWRSLNLPGDLLKRKMRLYEDGGVLKHHVRTEQYVKPIFEHNHEHNAREIEKSTSLWKDRSMVKVATIPLALIEEWRREGLDIFKGDPDVNAKIMARLNSKQYEKLRTAPGEL